MISKIGDIISLNQKNMFNKLEKIIFELLLYIRYRKYISIQDSLVKRCHFYFQNKSNNINFRHIRIFNSHFSLNGENNSVKIDNSEKIIHGLSVKIYGNNNFLEIKNGACIFGLRIVIRGESSHITIGENFSENINCMITCMGRNNYIQIGNDCMFSENIDIWNTDSHLITDTSNNIINKNKPIIIGNHVWVGKNSVILKGVTIGNNSIIGMSSVVTKNVDSNSIYAGNPAKKIKEGVNWNRDYAIL